MPRNAHYSQTMVQGNAGEAQQQKFGDPRPSPSQSPMVVQVSPQNQLFQHTDLRPLPSEQGMLSIGGNLVLRGEVQCNNQIDMSQNCTVSTGL